MISTKFPSQAVFLDFILWLSFGLHLPTNGVQTSENICWFPLVFLLIFRGNAAFSTNNFISSDKMSPDKWTRFWSSIFRMVCWNLFFPYSASYRRFKLKSRFRLTLTIMSTKMPEDYLLWLQLKLWFQRNFHLKQYF